MEDLTGREFGPYRIVEPLGEGGMASVYKAYQANMDRYVALKVLPRHFANDAQFVARFEQEAKVLAKLRHPHILPVHDYGQADGYTYLVMPYIESGTLINALGDNPLPLKKIERFISQVGDALDYAHSQGIVHRDVKPSNVLLDERENCMLVDFGIAKIVEGSANLTQTGGILGTPAYMAPEQGRGGVTDGRIDIYALGVILYEMATGRVPFKAETPIAVLVKHINDPLPPPSKVNPDLPAVVEQVILKAMAKNPDDRFTTAGEMVQALAAAVATSAPVANTANEQTVAEQSGATLTGSPQPVPATASAAAGQSGSKSNSSLWMVGGIGMAAVVFLLAACGLLLFGVGSFFQSAEISEQSPALEPAQLTATAAAAQPGSSQVAIGADSPEQGDEADTPPAEPTESPAKESPAEASTQPTATRTPRPTRTPSPTRAPTATPTPGAASVVLQFGEEGIGPGMFTDARSIAIDNSTGNIYVGEYIGGRVQVFDETGQFLTQWMVDPEMPLRGLDVNRNGQAYVVQSGLIDVYGSDTGEKVRQIDHNDTWGFDDVVVSADGGLVTSWNSYTDDIVRFNANGEPTLTITAAVSEQTGSSELDMRVAVDGLGNIYALGTFNSAVLKFGPDGKFLDMFGQGGDGPGALDSPQAIAVDPQGRIYVSELVGPIKIFDSGGQYLASINVQGLGMRFDDQGNLYVASRTRILKYEINLP